jgi:putative endonuclease
MEKIWYVYILECSDKTLYTGITTNLTRRVVEHNESSKGAKYTKARRPSKLVYSEILPNRSEASKREIEIKKLSKQDKIALIVCNISPTL